jgi:Alkaline phosphatase
MASYWQYGQKGQQTYDNFDVKLGMTTTPLNTSNTPTNSGVPQVSYDPAQAWSTAPSDGTSQGRPSVFEGYEYLKNDYTDSAAASTALATGQKTYNNAIDYDDFGQPLTNITQKLKEQGKATGTVTTVPISHATPAGFGAQNISRNNYGELSQQQIDGTLDLVIGAGNPWYNDDGQLLDAPNFANETGPGTAPTTGGGVGYVSESVYNEVTSATSGWTYLESKTDFEALADGSLVIDGPVYGLAQVGSTLQQARTEAVQGTDAANPSGVAFNGDVPSLATLTTGALNYLGQDEDGFFVMIEGGAVDWAAHANDTGRIIEEQIDFNYAVTAAYDWVEANSNWDETLLIVLTDHGNGLPLGPDSDTIAFQQVTNNGAGVLPGVTWYTGNHTNENTLFWATGAGSELFYDEVVGYDSTFAALIGHNADGAYIQNTAVYDVIARANGLGDEALPAVPVPAPVLMLGSALVALFGMSRRRRT